MTSPSTRPTSIYSLQHIYLNTIRNNINVVTTWTFKIHLNTFLRPLKVKLQFVSKKGFLPIKLLEEEKIRYRQQPFLILWSIANYIFPTSGLLKFPIACCILFLVGCVQSEFLHCKHFSNWRIGNSVAIQCKPSTAVLTDSLSTWDNPLLVSFFCPDSITLVSPVNGI